MHQNSHRPSRRDIIASATDSLNRSRCVQSSHNSPQNVPSVRSSISTSCLVSPNHSRRQAQGGSFKGTRSTHGSRTGSPLTVTMPIENIQSINAAYSMSQTYLGEGLGNAVPSPNSPGYMSSSPAHSRSNSVHSLLRNERDHYNGGRTSTDRSVYTDRHTGFMRDRSLDRRDRSLDRQIDMMERYNTYSGRDRSLDRGEYVPHMGARSLEREHNNLTRSRSIDQEYIDDQPVFFPSTPEAHHSKDTLILDLQTHIAQLNKECSMLRKDAESTKDKLSSSMNSIKTFWSPELKKERAMRKEESAKQQALQDQVRLLQAESQTQKSSVDLLERQLKDSPSPSHRLPTTGDSSTDSIRRQSDRLVKEIAILRKTVEEMEIRIDTQKQTLCARDESIKKLLEMLQSKGLAVKQLEEDRVDLEQLRTRVSEDGRQIKQLEGLLENKDTEITRLTQDLQSQRSALDLSGENASTQVVIQTKDLQIESLEMELWRLRQDREGQEVSEEQLVTLETKERLLKTKLDNVKAELAQKHTELCSLQTRVETWDKQEADHHQHISVLKEQITAKEQQGAMLQTDISSLQERLREKDEVIRQKGKQLYSAQNDRKRVDLELGELQDHRNIRERKVSVLQEKVENLEEELKYKEDEIAAMTNTAASVSANQNSVDSLVAGLQESLNGKEKQIERFKEQRERSDVDHQEALARCESSLFDATSASAEIQTHLDEKQASVLELQKLLWEMKTEKRSCETEMRSCATEVAQLRDALSERSAEAGELQERLDQFVEQRATESSETEAASRKKLSLLQGELHKSTAATDQAQKEADRLLLILQESETEKNRLDEQVREQQEQVKDLRQKMDTLKQSQQTGQSQNLHILEEGRLREEALSSDTSQLKTLINEYSERVEELEEALRESVKITAQREMVMVEQEAKIEYQDKQARNVSEEIARLGQTSVIHGEQVTAMESILAERDASLLKMQGERTEQMRELYEMKQEAIVAAISEKDAHIALLEMTPNSNQYNIEAVEKLTQEKIQLQKQLSEVTQKRMKLVQCAREDQKSPTDGGPTSRIPIKKSPKKQKNSKKDPLGEGSGIWT